MNDFMYYIYDRGELLAGFVSLCTAVTFCEEWTNSNRNIDLVDSSTGEIIDTWANGQWENGKF